MRFNRDAAIVAVIVLVAMYRYSIGDTNLQQPVLLDTYIADNTGTPDSGYVSAYSRSKTDQVINNRKKWGQLDQNVSGVVFLAVLNCDDVGKNAAISYDDYWLDAVVFDCAEVGASDGDQWMINNQIVAEVDWYTWQAYPDLVHSWQEVTIFENGSEVGSGSPDPSQRDVTDLVSAIAAIYGEGGYTCTQCTLHGLSGMQGYDVKGGCGAPLYSPFDGTITYYDVDGYNGTRNGVVYEQGTMIQIESLFGDVVVIIHANIYDNNDQPFFTPPVSVKKGQHIAYEDSFGWSTGCHSHIVYK